MQDSFNFVSFFWIFNPSIPELFIIILEILQSQTFAAKIVKSFYG